MPYFLEDFLCFFGDFLPGITLTDEVEIVYEKRITPLGNGAQVDAPKRYIGNRAYVIILKV